MSDWPLGGGGPLEADARDTANSRLIAVSDGGSDNALGSWVQLIAAATYSAEGFYLECGWPTATVVGTLLDIGIGGAGSEEVILQNVSQASKSTGGSHKSEYMPLRIPQGVRVAARMRQNGTQPCTLGMSVTLVAKGFGGERGFGSTDSIAAVTGSSRGTSIDPGSTINTKGGWVELVAASSNAYKHILVCVDPNNNTAATIASSLIDIGIGGAGSEQVIIPNIFRATDDFEIFGPCWFGFPVNIAAGQRIAARAQCSINDATDRMLSVCLVGFY